MVINIIVKHTLEINLSDAYETICDFQNYSHWWSIPIKTIDIGSGTLEIKPFFLVAIGIKVIPQKDKPEVRFDYTKGPFRGYGIWKFDELKNKKTQISYEVFLFPTNMVYGIVGRSDIFREKHKKDIKNIIERIKTALNSK